jgi:acetyltransferase-like isoleucine patch superfamily enzyme
MKLFNEVSKLKSQIKKIIKKLLWAPKGVSMGDNSSVRLPRWIFNPHRITIGENSRVGRFATLNPVEFVEGKAYDGKIVIGDGVYIGGYCQIHSMGLVEIGDGSVLSEHVYVSDIAHGFDPKGGPIMEQDLESKGPVSLGSKCFVGYGASILPGVTLGHNCIVGTRAVVTRSFPPYSVLAGSPARLIKTYDEATGIWITAKGTSNV